MTRIGFVSSILVSVVLIGGALWFRFGQIPVYRAQLASVGAVGFAQQQDGLANSDSNADIPISVTSSTTISTTSLAPTDQFSRQLFSDYIALKSQGQTSTSTINALANKYAEKVASIDLGIEKVSLDKLNTVPDSEESLTIYGKAMSQLRVKYRGLVETAYNSGKFTEIGSPEFLSFMGEAGKLYEASIKELMAMPVPLSLAQNHLDIINNYFESAKVMKMAGDTSVDPMLSYAALSQYFKNSGKETQLLQNIQSVLQANGIPTQTSI